jgi:hypothetical protein
MLVLAVDDGVLRMTIPPAHQQNDDHYLVYAVRRVLIGLVAIGHCAMIHRTIVELSIPMYCTIEDVMALGDRTSGTPCMLHLVETDQLRSSELAGFGLAF